MPALPAFRGGPCPFYPVPKMPLIGLWTSGVPAFNKSSLQSALADTSQICGIGEGIARKHGVHDPFDEVLVLATFNPGQLRFGPYIHPV